MGPAAGLVSWGLPQDWCHGACRRIGVMGPAAGLVSWGLPQDWCHGACRRIGVMGPAAGLACDEFIESSASP